MPHFPKTTLILGAGASIPYGFPSGPKLMTNIIDRCDSLGDIGFDRSLIKWFKDDLIHSDSPSIDTFLSKRPEYHDLGKFLISFELLSKENIDEIFTKDKHNPTAKWYGYFFKYLSLDDLNNLKIISFNYDRSLEYYLLKQLRASHGLSETDVVQKLDSLDILHVHGRLPTLPNEKTNINGVPFGSIKELNIGSIETCHVVSQNLRTAFDEVQKESKHYQEIIEKSQRVIFLGFSFIAENMKTLGFDFNNATNPIACFGSLFDEKRMKATNVFNKYQRIKFFNKDCISFFESSVSIMTQDSLTQWKGAPENHNSLWP